MFTLSTMLIDIYQLTSPHEIWIQPTRMMVRRDSKNRVQPTNKQRKAHSVNPSSAMADANWTSTSHDVFVHCVHTHHVCLRYFYSEYIETHIYRYNFNTATLQTSNPVFLGGNRLPEIARPSWPPSLNRKGRRCQFLVDLWWSMCEYMVYLSETTPAILFCHVQSWVLLGLLHQQCQSIAAPLTHTADVVLHPIMRSYRLAKTDSMCEGLH